MNVFSLKAAQTVERTDQGKLGFPYLQQTGTSP